MSENYDVELSAKSLGFKPIPSRPLDHPAEYYNQPVKSFSSGKSNNSIKSSNKGYSKFALLILFIVCFAGGWYVINGDNSYVNAKLGQSVESQKTNQSVTTSSAVNKQQKQSNKQVADKNTKQGSEKTIAKNGSEMLLGKVELGMKVSDLNNLVGKSRSKKMSDGYEFYAFDGIEIGLKNNVVDALVSDGSSFSTKRGIHEGSTYKQMVDAYGKDYMVTKLDNLTLYEYGFNDKLNRKGLLRFAIRNNDKKVDYISVRII